MSRKDIGIDLGTANTLICIKSKGIMLDEPSFVAINPESGKVQYVGREAKEMLGRTHCSIKALRPLKRGVVADYEAASVMLSYFIKKAFKTSGAVKPRAVISVPTDITPVERKATVETALRAGIRNAVLIEEPILAAMGADLDVSSAQGTMIVDIGSGITEVAVLSMGGIVTRRATSIAGDFFNQAIISYIRKKYGIIAGESSAENIKLKIGTVMKDCSDCRCEISGRSFSSGLPRTICMSANDIRSALLPSIYKIVDVIKTVLEDTPCELSADILKSGITLTGGGAMIDGIDRLICTCTAMPVRLAENPARGVINGLSKLLNDKELDKKIFKR